MKASDLIHFKKARDKVRVGCSRTITGCTAANATTKGSNQPTDNQQTNNHQKEAMLTAAAAMHSRTSPIWAIHSRTTGKAVPLHQMHSVRNLCTRYAMAVSALAVAHAAGGGQRVVELHRTPVLTCVVKAEWDYNTQRNQRDGM